MTFLIAHLNSAGSGVGQAEITANTEVEAREQFAILFPDREISIISIKDS